MWQSSRLESDSFFQTRAGFVPGESKFSLGARQPPGDARVVPTRGVRRARERLEQRLDDVMRLVAVKQFQVQIAAGLVGKGLEKLAREAEPERARSVLVFFRVADFFLREMIHPAPDEVRPSAEINHAAREAFVHRHVGFSSERIFRMKAVSVTSDAALVAERGGKRLSERNAAVLDGVVRVHRQIALAGELQIQNGVPGKEREHVVEKWNAGFDGGFALAVEVEPDGNLCFQRAALEVGLATFHCVIKAKRGKNQKAIAEIRRAT